MRVGVYIVCLSLLSSMDLSISNIMIFKQSHINAYWMCFYQEKMDKCVKCQVVCDNATFKD